MQNGIRLRRVLSLMRSKYKNNLESLMIKNVTEGGKNGVKKNFKVNLCAINLCAINIFFMKN